MDLTGKLLVSLGSAILALTGLILFSILWLRHRNKEAIIHHYTVADYPELLVPMGGLVISIFVLTILVLNCAEEYNKIKCEKIVSIDKSLQTRGEFVLGTGAVHNITYYFTYEDLGNNQYKLCKFETNQTIIVETTEPKYYVADIKRKNEFDNNYYIYVPVGTITREFKL